MTSDLIDFIRSYREPVSIHEAAAEIMHLGTHGAAWPRASPSHWVRELRALVDAGELVLNGEMLTVAKKEELRQGELFE